MTGAKLPVHQGVYYPVHQLDGRGVPNRHMFIFNGVKINKPVHHPHVYYLPNIANGQLDGQVKPAEICHFRPLSITFSLVLKKRRIERKKRILKEYARARGTMDTPPRRIER